MGNVGHGDSTGIQLRNGRISHSWFAAQDLRGEIYFFNSCEVYNSPFISSMLNSGEARTYSGGVLKLPVGLSEEVFKDFWDYTLNDDWEMGAALIQGEINNNLQGYYGIGGDDGVLKLTTTGTLNRDEVWLGEISVVGNVYVPSGKTLTVKTGATINLNGYYVKSTGGTITIESNVDGNFVELKTGSSVKALYPSIESAISNANSGQTVSAFGNHTLSSNVSVTSGITFKIKPESTVNLNGKYIKSTGGSIVQESGSTITGLKAYLKYYSTLKGYFPSVSSAISNASSNQQVELLANTTYNENISISNKYNVDLKGASNGSSIVNGNITITNSNYSSVYNVKMHNGHKITINGGKYSDISHVNYINTSDAVYFYDGYLNDLWDTNINSGGGQAPACKFYNTTSDVGDININDGYDFAVYSTNNASLTVGTASYFCNNMFDLYATSGGYIYAYNNTMSAPWPMSVAGNVSGSSPYSCSQQMAKSNLLNNDDKPLSDELNTLNVEYAELNHTISTENEEKTPEVMDRYKSDFDALITDYKSLLNEKSEPVEVTGILSKIEKWRIPLF